MYCFFPVGVMSVGALVHPPVAGNHSHDQICVDFYLAHVVLLCRNGQLGKTLSRKRYILLRKL